jgi:hypothetical protein
MHELRKSRTPFLWFFFDLKRELKDSPLKNAVTREKLCHGAMLESKKRVFPGYSATEPRASEAVARTHQMQTRIFRATQFNDHRAAETPQKPLAQRPLTGG